MTTLSITDQDLVFLMGVLEIGFYVVFNEDPDDSDYFDGSRGKGFDSRENFCKSYEKIMKKISNADKRIDKNKKKKEKKNKD